MIDAAPKRILLTENHDLIRQMWNDYLVDCGYQVLSLADGSGFFQTLANFQPHLILLSLKLPDINGYKLLQQIQQGSDRPHIPVIAICGLVSKADREHALSLETCRYLIKPVSPTVLKQAIQDELFAKEKTSYQVEEQLLHNAFHDVLTGLPNRALFMDRLGQAVEHAKRHEDYLFAVLFLDLDCFKLINDHLGHTFGDHLLRTIAGRLETCVRPTDTAARLGGDEFTILLEGIKGISDAIKVADRIQAELKLPFALGEQHVFATASIGIAGSETGYDQPEDILRDADIAMYRAKSQGKARYEIFNTDMHIRAVVRLQLETDLHRAFERQEFRIHYQPIIAFNTGLIAGFEALVRWQHPTRGLVPPRDFMPVAVETGLSISIDRWVLVQACRQAQQWQEQFSVRPPLTISVNVCSPQFAQTDFIEHIDQVLRETNLDANSLQLEITENVIMENSESAITTFVQLRKLGIQLSIDDFATGYSSLSFLHRFPISVLKIDCSFVSRMGVDEGNLEIVETSVMLAQKLGVDVTAEGVETVEQLRQLRALKCKYGQGYFFSRPLDSEAAEALLVANPQW